jgi:hypothetical protein
MVKMARASIDQIPLASAFFELLQFGCEIPAGSGGFFI